jgi:hypothetical protein
MGQYHLIVNLDKREFLDPHELGVGLKAWEQLASLPSTPQALFVLLLSSNGRGGSDLDDAVVSGHGSEPVIGRWAGDRLAVVGDYAEDGDLSRAAADRASTIDDRCRRGVYRETTGLVRPVLAAELGVEVVRHNGLWYSRHDPTASFSVLSGPSSAD